MRMGSAGAWRMKSGGQRAPRYCVTARLPKTPPPPSDRSGGDLRCPAVNRMNEQTALTIVICFNFFRPIVYTTLSSHRHIRNERKSFFIVTTRSTCRNMRVAQATAHHRNRRPLYVVAGVYIHFGTNVKKPSEKRDEKSPDHSRGTTNILDVIKTMAF